MIVVGDLKEFHAGHALGMLIIAAIEHLTARSYCCPFCCGQCMALNFYYENPGTGPEAAVSMALNGQRPDWLMPEDGTVNWSYLYQFWSPPAEHVCGEPLDHSPQDSPQDSPAT